MLRLLVCVLLASLVAAQSNENDPNWRLAWFDEFKGNSLDTTKWNARNIIGNQGNGELQWYSPSQVSVANDNLVITAAKITTQGMSYTSGWVDSQDLAYFTTGARFEIRAQMAGGYGMWPAIWMLSENTCWPTGIEYDIVEYRGAYSTQYALNYHYSGKSECCAIGVSSSCVTYYGHTYSGSADLSQGFHNYSMEIWPTNYTYYFDGVAQWTQQTGTGTSLPASPTPHYFIINSAVGGGYPGNPKSSTVFPNYLYVDYIRVKVYRQNCNGNPCSGNGCCNSNTMLCTCNPGWAGTSCEFNIGSAVHNFAAFTSLETCLNGYGNGYAGYITNRCLVANNQLTLFINSTGCGSTSCAGYPYGAGGWQSQSVYGNGSFTFVAKASSVSGAALTLQLTGSYGGLQQLVIFSIYGRNQVKISTIANNYYFNEIAAITLPFDSSTAFHTYKFVYSANGGTASATGGLTYFADNKQIWPTTGIETRNVPYGELSLGALFTIDPTQYGSFSYPGSMTTYLTSASWTTAGGVASC